MKDPKCLKVGYGSNNGAPDGECTGVPGVLSASEIQKLSRRGKR